jgi:hypothetical protein
MISLFAGMTELRPWTVERGAASEANPEKTKSWLQNHDFTLHDFVLPREVSRSGTSEENR